MELPRPIQNLIEHANAIAAGTGMPSKLFKLEATLITPNEQIELLIPNGRARTCNFGTGHSDNMQIRGQLQPGVYQNRILPFKDDLYMEVVKRVGYTQTVTRYRAIPLGDTNAQMQGGNTSLANMEAKDSINIVTVKFQLLETGYALLRNEIVADNFLMAKLDKVLHALLTEYGEKLQLTGKDAFRGVDIEYPFDNDRIFQRITIPSSEGVRLIDLGDWMQQDDQFGFYSKGLVQYYRKGMWFIRPAMKLGRYDTARKTVDIYRLPENVMPSIENSYFIEGNKLTILATGNASMTDGKDINKQNDGVGHRVVSPDALTGTTGLYYNRGQAMTTRGDSMSEYQTSKRGSGEEIVPFHGTPSANLCKMFTKNAKNDGVEQIISWHNSFAEWIDPATPCRYYYMNGDTLMYKEGTILSLYVSDQMDTQSQSPIFREHTEVGMFLNKEENFG